MWLIQRWKKWRCGRLRNAIESWVDKAADWGDEYPDDSRFASEHADVLREKLKKLESKIF